MADWTKEFESSYRAVRVSRTTLMETEVIKNAILSGSTITRNVDTEEYDRGNIVVAGDIDVGSDFLRIYLDATFADGTTESVPLGTFTVKAPKRSIRNDRSTREVVLSGLLSDVAEDDFEYPVTIPTGSNIVNEAVAIIRACGLDVVYDANDKTLTSQWVVGVGGKDDSPTSKLAIVNKLMELVDYHAAFTDPMGRVILTKYKDPADRSPSHVFEEGPLARFLTEAEEERDSSDVANVVVATFTTQDTETRGIAYDDDPRSPYSTVTLGRRKVKRYEYQDGATQAQANAKAAELLKTQQSVIRRVTLSHVYAPVTCNDVVGVEWPTANVHGSYAIRTQSIQLGAGCLTKSELRRFERGY